jgi:D-alanyl-D-alanine carboxypeptidase
MDARILQNLGSHLNQLVAEDRFSGSVLVAKGGKILFEQACGRADRAFNAPNKADTKFNLGSMNKMFTAVAILQLAQAGKLSLDDKLIEDLPDYPDKDIASKISIYQLLTHTSGLGSFFGERYRNTPKDKLNTQESYLPLFTGNALQFEPGTQWSYSNVGFLVLGLVIQHVSGEGYYDYVREHVFKPAEMVSTDSYDIDDDVPNLALGYTTDGGKPGTPPRTNHFFLARGTSAGGGYSTVQDLFRFARALEEHRLLNKEYTDMDMTGKVATTFPGDVKYAFGMMERFMNGVRIVGHSGAAPGISSNLDMYPGLGYIVAVLANSDDAAPLVNTRLRWELTGRELPQAIQLSREVLNGFVGSYVVAPAENEQPRKARSPIEITLAREGLWLQAENKRRFVPVSSAEFFDNESPGTRLTFSRDDQGGITGFTVTGSGSVTLTATKLP